jgi:hypothetical protein
METMNTNPVLPVDIVSTMQAKQTGWCGYHSGHITDEPRVASILLEADSSV